MDETLLKLNKLQNPVGIAADHGGFELKEYLTTLLYNKGFKVKDFGNTSYQPDDDYTDYVIPLANALRSNEISRGIAICGSGVGVTIAANKIAGVRACLIHDEYSAHQGVEDDNMNMICLYGLVVGHLYAWELVSKFLSSSFKKEERFSRRLEKIHALEIS